MEKQQKFKHGQRVRYVGNLVPSRTGKVGTVIDYKDTIMVRFDDETTPQRCFLCNLENLDKGDAK